MEYPSFTRTTKKRIIIIPIDFQLYFLFLLIFLSVVAKLLSIDREKENQRFV